MCTPGYRQSPVQTPRFFAPQAEWRCGELTVSGEAGEIMSFLLDNLVDWAVLTNFQHQRDTANQTRGGRFQATAHRALQLNSL
jgi:hypothetical protein